MTANRNFKRRVRARAAKTGESYTSALRHFRSTSTGDDMSEAKSMRLAVAQVVLGDDPRDKDAVRASGQEIRRLMREARDSDARLIHFPEGALCWAHKLKMSVNGPDHIGPADWDRAEWNVLRDELAEIMELARELRLWTVVGSIHRLTPPHRPHNSLYVISDRGEVATRYDERLLSNTKITYMYSPGSAPVTFEVDGVRFGLSLGIEVHFPEAFIEYEQLDVDCVLFSTAGPPDPGGRVFATEAQAHALTNSYWVSFAVDARHAADAPSGVVSPRGAWLAQCSQREMPSVITTEIFDDPNDLARPWRRKARAGIYEPHLVHDDPRSNDRSVV
ncbi:carbon-nitrogen hydrolase family protein [Phytoactinopolyspora endophytica]|uniref:carbon-nitrogen hydrolase family protein n=1 Tax=Phytoactinopolyspora endophytica TaxID=1642495 RepID=UPI00101BF333